MSFEEYATLSLAGECLSRKQCHNVLTCDDSDLLDLIHHTYRIRHHYFGNKVQIQVLTNAKSGICPEDCHYCSQSSVSRAEIDKYPLLPKEKLLNDARIARDKGMSRLCMATSGRRPGKREIEQLCEVIREIKAETGIPLCGSLGILEPGTAEMLVEAGLDRVNHNLNTSERFHPEICTTHTYQQRVDTIKQCQKAGLEICSGGIVGMGETDDDVIDLFLALRELGPEAIPVNFLVPIKGTPFENRGNDLTPAHCLKILCLARMLNPNREVRAAGGREYCLRSLQPLALYVIDSIFASGYLTTGGQSLDEAIAMIKDLGFEYSVE